MIKLLITILSYLLLFFNSSLFSAETKELKIGLLAPFSGVYKDLGQSMLLSTQLALDEINDSRIKIIPRDSGSNDLQKLKRAIKDISESGAKVVLGPTDSTYFDEIEKYNDLIFISLSNNHPTIKKNIVSIGISLESQLKSIEKFIGSQNKYKTIIMFPDNKYATFIEKKVNLLKLKNYKLFKYSSDPKLLTGQIQKLTNYDQRKRNLESRVKILEEREDLGSVRELKKLKQKYTLGRVNFDSVIIIDFGSSLKSVLTSLVFSDISEKDVLYTTVNQWFDESIFYENSIKTLYYPSVNLKNFKKYNKKYFETFNLKPNEITILAYDAIALIYYFWKKNKGIESINNFLIKDKIKGKIGIFTFNEGKVFQELNIYKTSNNSFIKY